MDDESFIIDRLQVEEITRVCVVCVKLENFMRILLLLVAASMIIRTQSDEDAVTHILSSCIFLKECSPPSQHGGFSRHDYH